MGRGKRGCDGTRNFATSLDELGGLQAVYHIWIVHEKEFQKLIQQIVV
jgi:hypothetical protein